VALDRASSEIDVGLGSNSAELVIPVLGRVHAR